jgi:hypothetical protein
MVDCMNLKGKIFILISVILYLIILYFKRNSIFINSFVNNYFTDLIFIPLQGLTSLWLTRIILKKHFLILNIRLVLFLFLFNSILFEFYLPYFTTHNSTSDWLDILMYFMGSMVFYILQFFTLNQKHKLLNQKPI